MYFGLWIYKWWHRLASNQQWKNQISKQVSHIWGVAQFCFAAWVAHFTCFSFREKRRKKRVWNWEMLRYDTSFLLHFPGDNQRKQVWTWIDLTIVFINPSLVAGLCACIVRRSCFLALVPLPLVMTVSKFCKSFGKKWNDEEEESWARRSTIARVIILGEVPMSDTDTKWGCI